MCWDSPSFHFHPTLASMLGATLIRHQVVLDGGYVGMDVKRSHKLFKHIKNNMLQYLPSYQLLPKNP